MPPYGPEKNQALLIGVLLTRKSPIRASEKPQERRLSVGQGRLKGGGRGGEGGCTPELGFKLNECTPCAHPT
jgi:hypothetical protein